MNTNLTNQERLALLCGALASFALAPTNSKKSDVQKAIKDYQDAWIANNKTDSLFGEEWDADALEGFRNEAFVAEIMQAIRFGILEPDKDVMASLHGVVDTFKHNKVPF